MVRRGRGADRGVARWWGGGRESGCDGNKGDDANQWSAVCCPRFQNKTFFLTKKKKPKSGSEKLKTIENFESKGFKTKTEITTTNPNNTSMGENRTPAGGIPREGHGRGQGGGRGGPFGGAAGRPCGRDIEIIT